MCSLFVCLAAQRLCSLYQDVLRLTSGVLSSACVGLQTHPLKLLEFWEKTVPVILTLPLSLQFKLSQHCKDLPKAFFSVLHCGILQPLMLKYT